MLPPGGPCPRSLCVSFSSLRWNTNLTYPQLLLSPLCRLHLQFMRPPPMVRTLAFSEIEHESHSSQLRLPLTLPVRLLAP